MALKLGILSTHPIQYYSPLYRELAARPGVDLTVYYAYQATAQNQAAAGFGVAFEWDTPLLDGYRHEFLPNVSPNPGSDHFRGCDTPAVADVIARERFDAFLVHGWYVRSYRQAIRACRRTGTPIMVRGDSTLLMARGRLRRLARWVSHRRMVPRFDAYLVVGRLAREYYLAFGADPARMVFSPHFVDNDRFAQAAAEARKRRADLRKEWGLPADAVVFLLAGKCIPLKRPLDFVRAVAAAARGGAPAAGLVVGDGPLRPAIEAAAAGGPVRCIGFVNQSGIPAAYAAADAVVLCSETETWGLVVNEGMACGLPAVVSDRVGCGPDLVAPGETGYVYPCGDVSGLAGILGRLAAAPAEVERLGAAAREKVSGYSVAAAADGVCRAAEAATGRRGVKT